MESIEDNEVYFNTYESLVKFVNQLQCVECHGSGKLDDLEAGDIGGNTYYCESCKGNGFGSTGK